MEALLLLLTISLLGSFAGAAAPYAKYILSPSSRTLHPVSIHRINGTVSSAASLTRITGGNAMFIGNSSVTFDYGKNIGGLVSIRFGSGNRNASASCIGVTFSESSLWISGVGSDATADSGIDEPLWLCPKDANAGGLVSADKDHDRGSFRYLSLIRNGTDSTSVAEVWTHFTPMPHIRDDALGEYPGYFFSNDEKLNRVWYAGVYTTEIDTITPTTGNALVHLGTIGNGQNITTPLTWFNNFTISNGTSVLTDGSKRDRLVWPGDMAITVPGISISSHDLISLRNALDSLFILQAPNGQLPYAGTPFHQTLHIFSATYHMYSLIGVANFYHFSGDLNFLETYWDQWKLGMNFTLQSVDSSGLMNVTSPADWLRFGMGGHNIEANSILFYTLNQGVQLAKILKDDSVVDSWVNIASTIKASANDLLWSDMAGMYIDNETTTLSPQDGNSWAIKSNLTDSLAKAASISSKLQGRWTPFGAPAPEAADAISPFISGFELEAHFLAGQPQRAVDLIRFMWADFMLDDPRMTNSTFIEGYSTTGELHYAPYTNDPRVSFCHGWATGPTSVLTFYIAGIQLIEAGGQRWLMAPQLADLTEAQAGFVTNLGRFDAAWKIVGDRRITVTLSTPRGTAGSMNLVLPFCQGSQVTARESRGSVNTSTTGDGRISVLDLAGGSYKFTVSCDT